MEEEIIETIEEITEEEPTIEEEEVFDYHKLRYILDSDGYIFHASLGGLIVCDLGECTEYTGEIPSGYSTIEEWYDGEIDKLNAWKIVDGNLVFDDIKYNEIQEQTALDEIDNSCVTHKELYGLQKEIEDIQDINNSQYTEAKVNGKIINIDNVKKVYPRIKINDIDCYNYEQVDIVVNKKNMLPIEANNQSKNGKTLTINKDKSLTLSGIATENTYFDLAGTDNNLVPFLVFKKDVNYYLNTDNFNVELYYFDGTDKELIYSGSSGIVKFDVDKKVTNIKLVIEKEYEELPLTLDEETGKYYLDGISEQKTTKGKNICPNDVNKWELGHYAMTGEKSVYDSRARLNDLIPVKPNTNYYVDTNNSKYNFVIRGYDKDKKMVTSYGQCFNGRVINTNNIYYLGVAIYNPSIDIGREGETILNDIESGEAKPFICLNSETDKSYEPFTNGAIPNPDFPSEIINTYKAGIYSVSNQNKTLLITLDDDLRSVGDVKDRLWIDFENETSEVNKNVGKVVLNGSEGWWDTTQYSGTYHIDTILFRTSGKFSLKEVTSKSVFSNYFSNIVGIWNNDKIGIGNTEINSLELSMDRNVISTTSQLNAWLKEKYDNGTPVIAYYALATITKGEATITKGEDKTIYPTLNLGTEPIEYEKYEVQRLSINFSEYIEEGLFPSDNLFPSDELFPKGTIISYILIENGTASIKVNETEEEIEVDKIHLFDGYNTIYTIQDTNIEMEYCINNLKLEGTVTKNNNFKVLEDGSIEAHNGFFSGILNSSAGLIGGWHIDKTSLWCNITPPYDYTEEDYQRIQAIMQNAETPSEEELEKYDFNKDGNINSSDLLTCRKLILYDLKHSNPGKIILDTSDWFTPLKIINSSGETLVSFGIRGVETKE